MTDDWLTRMYERHGVRYLYGAVAAIVGAIALVFGPISIVVPSHYMELSAAQTLRATAIDFGVGVLVLVLLMTAVRPQFRALRAWTRGQRDDAARARATDAAFGVARRVVLMLAIAGACAFVPLAAVPITFQADHATAKHFFEIWIGGLFALSMCVLLIHGALELALRPVRASLGLYRAPAIRVGLSARLLAGALLFPVITAVAVGGLTTTRHTASFFLVYALAVAFALLAMLAVGPLMAGSVLGPIRDLIRGARAVGKGDLDVQVPVTTRDELAELTQSFNEMVQGLRERDALRDHNTELVDELRESRARIVAAGNAERRRVERDLHDGAQQHLVLLNLELSALARSVEGDSKLSALVEHLQGDLRRALSELRDLAHGIYPPLLENEGLPGALGEAVERAAIPATLESDGAGRYPPELEAAVYFCCLEALQNAAKHAGEGARATVTLAEGDGALRFAVADDGPGFDPASVNGSAGLQNMADRIGALGGELTIDSAAGRGTTVAGSLPVRDAAR